jgi:glycerol-3-phosphate dehydrogenase
MRAVELERSSEREGDAGPRFDLIVIGAGINGAAVAREAALHGLEVLIVERDDICAGTSGASSRLIHGGLRYLEHAELSLVRESLHERERLLVHAPHLVKPLALYIPVYAGGRRSLWQIRAGMWLYDLLSIGKSLPAHTLLERERLRSELPGLASDGLAGGARYFDAQVAFPERLVLENVQDAVRHGAKLLTYTRVTGIRVEHGRVAGVEWRAVDGRPGRAGAPVVVNAAGPWVDTVLGALGTRRLIGGTKGSHLIVEPFPGAPTAGVYTEAAADGRPLFILPWNGLYLIGTTDERFAGDPAEAGIDERELDYLVGETERVFPGAASLRKRVLYTHSGVRPLPHRPHGKEGAITRRHLVHAHREARGLYSVIGGKLTTHRSLAEDVIGRVRRHLPALAPRSPTRRTPLPGAIDAAGRDALLEPIRAAYGVAQATRLWEIYGAGAGQIAARAADAELATEIGSSCPLLVAELVHALEAEWATTLVDILQRRCMAGLAADFGLAVAPAAAEWLRRLGFWDGARVEQELDHYRGYARRFRPRALREEM